MARKLLYLKQGQGAYNHIIDRALAKQSFDDGQQVTEKKDK